MFARELQSTLAPVQAAAIVGSIAQTFTATGTTAATAANIGAVKTLITSGADGTGAILPSGLQPADEGAICNGTSVNVYVYPPSGGKFNNATANAPVCLGANKGLRFTCIDGTNFMATIG